MADAPYWAVRRIFGTALDSTLWEAFDGSLALRGVDPLTLDVGQFCNGFWVWLKDRMQPGYGAEQAERQQAEMAWSAWVEWVNRPPIDWEVDAVSPQATAAAYARAREAGRG